MNLQAKAGLTFGSYCYLTPKLSMNPAIYYDDTELIFRFEKFLPTGWLFGVLQQEDDAMNFCRAESPNTYDRWESGYFNQDQLMKAGAYRTDLEPGSDNPLFPDGGQPLEDVVGVYETELEALLGTRGEQGYNL